MIAKRKGTYGGGGYEGSVRQTYVPIGRDRKGGKRRRAGVTVRGLDVSATISFSDARGGYGMMNA
ncbi:MAG: hypothetical protein JXR49_03065 [Acidobacteria bacterium]|nr:hypothetical protein [Acidobacteriota bacterium]